MCLFKKKKTKKQIVCLSDECVDFIKKYLINEMNITKPIDEDMLTNIENICNEYGDMFATKELNPDFVFDEQKSYIADKIAGEIYSALEFNIVDYDNLNSRLDLK